jgi:surface antigen
VQQLKKQGRWKGKNDPQPGDLVFFDWDGDKSADHVGIVKSVNGDGSITTIEGNTANPQNRAQEGVFEKNRGMGTVLGFGEVA